MDRQFDEVLRQAKTRRLLSALLCEPDLGALREERVSSRLLACLSDGLSKDATLTLSADLEGVEPEELLVDYARLFVGPDRIPAPPYGSVHLEADGLVMGKTTFEVLAYYESFGMHVGSGVHEPPDHIAIELEFCAWLLEKAAADLEGGQLDRAASRLEAHDRFEREFILPWARTFADLVVENARTPHYKAVAEALATTLYGDSSRECCRAESREREAARGEVHDD